MRDEVKLKPEETKGKKEIKKKEGEKGKIQTCNV